MCGGDEGDVAKAGNLMKHFSQ
jgi:3-hydroxyisobutyrate dehydrogenase